MGTETVPETSVTFNQLERLVAGKDFIKVSSVYKANDTKL
jgi:hypothetical protein